MEETIRDLESAIMDYNDLLDMCVYVSHPGVFGCDEDEPTCLEFDRDCCGCLAGCSAIQDYSWREN
jgi:hypothetical protein